MPTKLFTKENASEMGRKGALKKHQREREVKAMGEIFKLYLTKKETNPKLVEMMKKRGFSAKDITQYAVIVQATIEEAKKGKTKAIAFIRDTIGEKPADKHEVTGADGAPLMSAPISMDEAKELIEKLNNEI